MRRVIWTSEARRDYTELVSYAAGDSAFAADLLSRRVTEAAEGLGAIPTGRKGRVRGTHEKSVTKTRCIIAYSMDKVDDADVIQILHVVHTSRHWPKDAWPG